MARPHSSLSAQPNSTSFVIISFDIKGDSPNGFPRRLPIPPLGHSIYSIYLLLKEIYFKSPKNFKSLVAVDGYAPSSPDYKSGALLLCYTALKTAAERVTAAYSVFSGTQ